MQIREYLRGKRFRWQEKQRNGKTEAVMNCPFCGDTQKKFAINLSTGAFNCFHENSCGVQGSWWDFQRDLGDEPRQLDSEKSFYQHTKPTYQKPKPKTQKPESKVIEYLKGRGFTDETIKHFKIGQHNGDTVMIPFLKNGEVVNVKYRGLEKKDMWTEKNAEPVLFNRDNIKTNELIITEGEYDCMALHQYGIPSVSVPNGVNDFRWLENEWEWLEKYTTIYICFDDDVAGQKGLQEIVQRLGLWRCKTVRFPKKDANDCLKSNIPKPEMYDCLANAQDFKPAMLTSPEEFIDAVHDLFIYPEQLKGTSTGWEKLNKILGGWREAELTIWSGRNSAGKSTILNQVILNLAKNNVKSCIASLEMRVPKYLRWAVMQHTGKSFLYRADIEKALNWMNGKIYLVDTLEALTPETLIDVFEYAARKYGVKHFLVDSLMKLSFPDKDELKEQKSFVNQLTQFADKFQCHVHLVAHPRKGIKDSDRPGKVDVMGTGHITNLAHNVLIMHRPGEEEHEAGEKNSKQIPDAVLYVKKNREMGTEGSLKLRFDPETKKFYE